MTQATAPFRPSHPDTAAAPLRILIVDDDRDIALSLKEAVEDLGDVASVGYTGSQAVAMALSNEPDVVLLDLSLPDMTGLQVAEALRGIDGARPLKIIAVTGFADADAKRQTAAAGFDLHLAKPIRLGVLSSILDLLRVAP